MPFFTHRMKIQKNVPLSAHTTFRTGGRARFFIEVQTEEEIQNALALAREKNLPVFILGGGSNVLADDGGCDGVVIKIVAKGIVFEEKGGVVHVKASSGENWNALVEECVARKLWGIENLSGIPGSVGAAPLQNIGAYGTELKDVFMSADVLDRQTLASRTLTLDECGFGYRTSVFKRREKDHFIILSVTLRLQTQGRANIAYRDLAEVFTGVAGPSLVQVRKAVLSIRARKFPDINKEGTAGSFFKNPIVPKEKADELLARYPDLPHFESDGGIKLSLAWILDKILELRGEKRGGVRAFERQPLVLVNDGSASAKDVREFAKHIARRVFDSTGITLEPEVCIMRGCASAHELF